MGDSDDGARRFAGEVCVITGAGSGIGRALALNLARRGARLAISDINPDSLRETAEQAAAAGAEVDQRTLDVANRDSVFEYASHVREHFGGPARLVINNAGVAVTATVADTKPEDFEWLMGINFWGMVHGSQAFLPQLIESGDGHLVNISSVFGLIGVPYQSAYCAAKFGIRGFTESLRQEMLMDRLPVAVSCVHPGGVRTNIVTHARTYDGLTPEHRAKQFERIARLTPDKAAEQILKGVERRAPRILVGADAKVIEVAHRVLGTAYQRIVPRLAKRAATGS